MSESSATAIYFLVASLHLSIAFWKGFALLRAPSPSFALQTATHAVGGIVYVVASPWGYRSLGSALGHPWFPTLPIYVGILCCFGTNHLLTILWTPSRPGVPWRARRSITAWSLAYGFSLTVMIIAFFGADLEGPAVPLEFNTEQVDDPHVFFFLTVFLTMLTCGTVSIWRRSRRARIDDEAIMHAVRWFGASMLVTFGYVVCSAPAIVAASLGHHQLDGVGVMGSAFGSVGSVMTCYGVSGAVVSKWVGERRDIAGLQPLWELVVAGVDEELSLGSTWGQRGSSAAGPSADHVRFRPHRLLNVRWTLTRRVIEILDGIRELERGSWVRSLPADSVRSLYQEAMKADELRRKFGLGKKGLSEVELEAAATAAVLRDAVERLQNARTEGTSTAVAPVPDGPSPAHDVPGKKTPAANERPRLVRVARALDHPLVEASLQVVESLKQGAGAAQASAGAR
ncbi:hypothetical protein OG440_39030 (plasmid) [Streptomyces sp. NBC_00637]|uniref:DUF6545 domain-containing protein n=1 Tax=Streptomyces sp. NBC_00637 TaxID=2903667 RepID=UPI002F90DB42